MDNIEGEKVIGWFHIAVGLCFIFGAVLVDIDHVKTCSRQELVKAFNGEDNLCKRGVLHNPIILYCLISLTLGLLLHLKMDGII
jgi:hypothetical protein